LKNKLVEYFENDTKRQQEFTSLLIHKKIRKSSYFLKSNEECNYLGIVVTGTLRSYYVNELGDEISFLFHLEGQFFTDYESVLLNSLSNLNIQALEDTEVLMIHKEDLFQLYQKDIFWQEFGRKITEEIYLSAKKRVENLLFYSPEKRYLNLLLENNMIFQKVQQKYIASYLGIKPQSLSRIRKRLLKC